jgi:large exoprotein involved in heme utilization and adhesion
LTGAERIFLDGGLITTEAVQASGGNITLQADELIQMNNSKIASSVQGDVNTAGGDISLDPDFIILQNSQILAKAVQGQGGNITLIANDAVLVDPFSVLDASSALGVSGSVNIQAPIQNLSGTIVPLPQDPVPVTALYGSRCVAGAGGHFSTFVDSKADSLAPTPGTFLASPFLPSLKFIQVGDIERCNNVEKAFRNKSMLLHLQVATYSPPVLFGHGEGMLSVCP